MESHPLKKRKICVVVNDRAIYGRVKPVMEAIQKHPQLELQVIAVTNFYFDHLFWYLFHGEPVSFLKALSWYIKARTTKILGKSGEVEKLEYLPKLLITAGFPIHARLPLFLEGGNTRVMVKSAGLGLLGIPKLFEKLKPDIVLIYADRFESLPIAMAAAFLNIPIAHVEGGDVSGTIDESVRHAITKLAHIHFPVTEKSRQRLIRMGENPDFVFMPGFSGIDFIKSIDLGLDDDFFMYTEEVDFCFNEKEVDYIEDVKKLMFDIFGLSPHLERHKTHGEGAAWAVHSLVSRFDYGNIVDVTGSLEDALKDILSYLPTPKN